MLKDALFNLINELNSGGDNPIIYPQDGDGLAFMGVNYVGIYCFQLIKNGTIIDTLEEVTGEMEF